MPLRLVRCRSSHNCGVCGSLILSGEVAAVSIVYDPVDPRSSARYYTCLNCFLTRGYRKNEREIVEWKSPKFARRVLRSLPGYRRLARIIRAENPA